MEEVIQYVPNLYATFWALIPPLVAIILALITKEVYSSLFVGIVIGGLFYGNIFQSGFSFEKSVLHIFEDGLVGVLSDPYNVGILVFLVVLGIMVCMMNKAGGSAAFGEWAGRHIKTRVGAQLVTVLLGILIFIDDYFNCLTVGSVMRPVTDKHNVSRAKLAYLIDSTAAPICIIAPISSWAAAVTGFVEGEDGFGIFIKAIPYNYYALFTIAAMILIVVLKVDFGSMAVHEANAAKGDLYTTPDRPYANATEDVIKGRGRVLDLLFPIITLIVCCIIGMLYSGDFFKGVGFVDAFSGSDASVGLMLGSFFALIITIVFYAVRRVLSFNESCSCIPEGFKAMVPAILILTFAWTLKAMTDSLGAKEFVAGLVKGVSGGWLSILPAVIFLVAVFLAFATGTSWGTFGILIPIVVNTFSGTNHTMMIISISACMAGAVCGDHCSPISDTTIMASAGAQCNHMNHVSTQLPYVIVVAVISCVTYVIAGFVQNPVIPLIVGFVILIGALIRVRVMNNIKGSLILLLTAFIWGTAFVAQTSGAGAVGTFTFNAARSIVGALFLAVVIVIKNVLDKRNNSGKVINTENESHLQAWPLGAGIICGIVLFAAMTFQQYGISVYPQGVAASGRSGFITATYVVMVSVVSVFMGKKMHWITGVSVAGCVAGMYLLCMSGGIDSIYPSDILLLLCAVGFTVHILVVDKYSYTDGIKMSCIQFLTAGIMSAVGMIIIGHIGNIRISDIKSAAVPILYAGIMSSGVAYTLQIIGQKYTKPSVTAIVLSLESVFAALAGWILLSEHLSPHEIAGCVLVFIAVIMAQIPQMSIDKEKV